MTFKCKMCGGDIEPIKGTNTGKCLYCKSVMTLPNIDNERILNLYNRANDLRLNSEFDKAREIYEAILKIDNNQVEAHWGILLCKYGVEYVDDPKTKTKIPTCHRTNDYSILLDSDFKYIKKEAYGDALKLYEKEAKQIDEIQKNILAISSKEKPYDVFICYKETDNEGNRTHDSVIAQDIYDKLIDQGFKVFFARITLENKLGKEYEPYIYSALKSAKVMLVVGTKEENFSSIWVKNEWSRFLEMMRHDKSKVLIPVYSKIDAYKLPEEFAMLQAQSMDKVGAIQDLVRGVKKIIDESKVDDIEGIDKETIAKVQNALDEAKNLGNGKYEVTVLKENLPTWYYIVQAVIFFIAGFFYLALPIGYYSEPTRYILILLSGIFFILSFIFCFKRKTYKYKSLITAISIVLLILQFNGTFSAIINNLASKNFIATESIIMGNFEVIFTASFIIIAQILSSLLNPSWSLNSSTKSIMTVEEKDTQIEKNQYIKNNFKTKEKSKGKIIIIIIIIITILIFIVSAVTSINNEQTNKRDETKDQIEITTEYLRIRQEPNTSNGTPILGEVKKGEIYTILNSEVEDEYDGYNSRWYKIKTSKGVTGYVYSGDKNEYIKKLERR